MSAPTVRKFPRTMDEAFPRGVEYACSVERHRAPMGFIEALLAWVSISGMSMLIAWSVVA